MATGRIHLTENGAQLFDKTFKDYDFSPDSDKGFYYLKLEISPEADTISDDLIAEIKAIDFSMEICSYNPGTVLINILVKISDIINYLLWQYKFQAFM